MTTVKFENANYILDCEPQMDNAACGGVEFVAPAKNQLGQKFLVTWDVTNSSAELEEDMCNWDNPSKIERS